MDRLFGEIRARIPANKFYPPVLDPSHYLIRKRLLQTLQLRNSKITLLEAQAGQGKTVLAAQYLEQIKSRFAWYQVGPEDGDPVLFLTALLSCLMEALPGFRSPLLETMIAKGEVTPLELPRFANILLGDLNTQLKWDFHFVFDDLHLLEGCEASLGLLGHVLENAPPKLSFVLAARRPVDLDLPVLKNSRQTLAVGNEELALTELEIAELYNDILKVPVAGKAVRELYEATEGWMMGLLLVAHTLEKRGGLISEKGNLRDYLHAEIFTGISEKLQKTLLKLSWLDQIPVALAAKLSEVPDIGHRLAELNRKNFFIRSLDEKDSMFRFHHLFQEYLQKRAEQELLREEIQGIFVQAAGWCLEQGKSEEALGYYLKAQDYEALEKVLEKEGMALLALNRITTLQAILSRVPEKNILEQDWLAFFFGMIMAQQEPPLALRFLQRSLALFSVNGNEVGVLLATAQIVYFHLNVDTKFNKGLAFLEKLEKTFQKVQEDLAVLTRIKVAQIISSALVFFTAEMEKSRKYSDIALKCASDNRMENVLAEIYLARVWGCFPHWKQFSKEIENSYHLTFRPSVSAINKMLLRLSYINCLEMSGDFENYQNQEHQLMESIENNLIAKTLSGPFLLIWKMDIAIANGNFQLAADFVQVGLNLPYAGSQPHLRSQFLHYLAFLRALKGEKKGVSIAAEESLRLRAEAGGKIFFGVNELIVGGAYALLAWREKAEEHLGKAIGISGDLNEEFIRAGAHAHRAFIRLNSRDMKAALSDVRECLRCLKENDYVHFFSWTSLVMKPVLETAVKHSIEVDYARKLARERLGLAILSDGASIPLLQISTLGGLSIAIECKVVLKAEGLTQTQRELLTLLIASPGLKKCEEKIQAALWPDSTPEKARANFDNLLMRLRKTLGQALEPHSVKHYLSLQKGMLCLENCRLDAAEFATKARKGLEHAGRKEFWQAGNAFHSAHNLWNGSFLPNGSITEEVQSYRGDLERLYMESTFRGATILTETGRFEDAGKILERAVQHHPTDDDLVRCLYRLRCKSDKPAQAWQVLRQYEAALQAEDYSPAEIEEILQGVSNSAF